MPTHVCTFDREVAELKYLKSPATCKKRAYYYKSCKCGAETSVAFAYGEPLPHKENELVDDEFKKSDATCTSGAVYYKSCDCGKKWKDKFFESGEPRAHKFTKAGYDGESHWTECVYCGEKKDVLPHTLEGNACTKEGCGFEQNV